jgi:hypothetical protein
VAAAAEVSVALVVEAAAVAVRAEIIKKVERFLEIALFLFLGNVFKKDFPRESILMKYFRLSCFRIFKI